MAHEGSSRELPIMKQENPPRGSIRRNRPEKTGKRGNQKGEAKGHCPMA